MTETSNASRIPSLDGLRALAVASVMAAHATTRGVPAFVTPEMKLYIGLLASFGVRVFFVLSGFLITSILLREIHRDGKLSLRRFYWRRGLRIFPAFYVFLALISIPLLRAALGVAPSPHLVAAAAYVSNYFPTDWTLGHTWSLSVEEQFYLLWPVALIFSGKRHVLAVPVLLTLVAPLARYVYVYHHTYNLNLYHFECVADSLAAGCILARCKEGLNGLLQRFLPSGAVILACVACIATIPLSNYITGNPYLSALAGVPLMNAAIGMLILSAILQPPWLLNCEPMKFLGRISYPLYLWQQPWVQTQILGSFWPLGAAGCAYASFALIERPILRWRDRARTVSIESSSPEAGTETWRHSPEPEFRDTVTSIAPGTRAVPSPPSKGR
jgi:peptidoglycan/LPS O-acetylase OafA/YrhL